MLDTWTCHICGKERSDDKISVYKKDISEDHGLPLGTMEQNVRYCNDDLECGKAAKTHSHFKKKEEKKVIHLDIDDVLSHHREKKVTLKDYVTWYFIFFALVSILNSILGAIMTDDTFYERLIHPTSFLIRMGFALYLSVLYTKKITEKF